MNQIQSERGKLSDVINIIYVDIVKKTKPRVLRSYQSN